MLSWLTNIGEVFSASNIVRGSGMTAYVLLFAVVGGGLLLSLQLLPAKGRASFLAYHKAVSIAALVMLFVHGLSFFFDKYQYLQWQDVLVPFWTHHKTTEIATGIIAAYVLVALAVASLPSVMKALRYENWRMFHYLAFACYWIALYHGVMLGKANNALFLSFVYPVTASLVTSLTLMRIWKIVERWVPADESSVG